jgi:hypothetical protein
MKLILIAILFLLGLYVYMTSRRIEGMTTPTCPNLLIQQGERILLQNTGIDVIPGVNPIVFQSLDEYTKYVQYQESKGIHCPVLVLQPSQDAQNETKYQVKPSLLVDASRTHPPFNTDSYPGFDAHNQSMGEVTMLDEITLPS